MDKNSNLIPISNSGYLKLSYFRIISLTFVLVALMVTSAFASAFKVSGTVVSATDNQPLPGVSIQEKGGKAGTTTGPRSEFSLNVSSANATLIFSFIGFETEEVAVDGNAVINISLSEKTSEI